MSMLNNSDSAVFEKNLRLCLRFLDYEKSDEQEEI